MLYKKQYPACNDLIEAGRISFSYDTTHILLLDLSEHAVIIHIKWYHLQHLLDLIEHVVITSQNDHMVSSYDTLTQLIFIRLD